MKLRPQDRGGNPTVREGSGGALAYARASAPRPSSPAAMLAIVFRFLRSSLANLSFILQRDELACIFFDLIRVGAVIFAPVAAAGGNA